MDVRHGLFSCVRMMWGKLKVGAANGKPFDAGGELAGRLISGHAPASENSLYART